MDIDFNQSLIPKSESEKKKEKESVANKEHKEPTTQPQKEPNSNVSDILNLSDSSQQP